MRKKHYKIRIIVDRSTFDKIKGGERVEILKESNHYWDHKFLSYRDGGIKDNIVLAISVGFGDKSGVLHLKPKVVEIVRREGELFYRMVI